MIQRNVAAVAEKGKRMMKEPYDVSITIGDIQTLQRIKDNDPVDGEINAYMTAIRYGFVLGVKAAEKRANKS